MGDIESFAVSAAHSSKVQIGDSCSLYKTCGLCGELKYYREFGRRGGNPRKRKSLCSSCAVYRKDEIVKQPSPPLKCDFDVTKLDDARYGCIYFNGTNNRWRNEVSLQEAIRYVSRGQARIRNPHNIVHIKDREPFVTYILERDGHICQNCGNLGTEVLMLPDRNQVRCFCKTCATSQAPLVHKVSLTFSPPTHGELHVYCDGSAFDNLYGCGVVLVDYSEAKIKHQHTRCARKQHSLYAELLAVSYSLRTVDDYLDRCKQKIKTVYIFSDISSIENFIDKRMKRFQDVYIAKEAQEISLLLNELRLSYPGTNVSVSYLEDKRNQFHRLAHRLSRSYLAATRPVYEIELQTLDRQPNAEYIPMN